MPVPAEPGPAHAPFQQPPARRCSSCDAFTPCLRNYCRYRRQDSFTNQWTLVAGGGPSGYCFVEPTPLTCQGPLVNASSSTGFSFITSSWQCVPPKDCPVPPQVVYDEYNNGARVAYGFAIAGAAVLLMCCGLAFCAFSIAGKNAAARRMGGGGGRGAAYEVKGGREPRGGVPPEYDASAAAAAAAPEKKRRWFSRG